MTFDWLHLHFRLFPFLQSLVDVEHRWKDVDIDMCEYKDKYFKIKSTEDLFQVCIVNHENKLFLDDASRRRS